jgi:hypothetical protein
MACFFWGGGYAVYADVPVANINAKTKIVLMDNDGSFWKHYFFQSIFFF